MRYSFQTNMKCQACLERLAPVLDAAVGVDGWNVDLSHAQKLLSIKSSDTSAEDVIALVAEVGFKAIQVDVALEAEQSTVAAPDLVDLVATHESKQSFSLSVYRPLLIVVAYVAGATILLAAARGNWTASELMSNFMGCFFLGFAFFKLLNVRQFAESFSTYDPIAHRLPVYGRVYPFVELALGLMFVTKTGLVVANLTTVVILGIGLVGVVQAVSAKRTIQCACLGTVFNLPMTSVTILENTVMVVMALAALAL